MVGAFFIDILNAMVIQGLARPAAVRFGHEGSSFFFSRCFLGCVLAGTRTRRRSRRRCRAHRQDLQARAARAGGAQAPGLEPAARGGERRRARARLLQRYAAAARGLRLQGLGGPEPGDARAGPRRAKGARRVRRQGEGEPAGRPAARLRQRHLRALGRGWTAVAAGPGAKSRRRLRIPGMRRRRPARSAISTSSRPRWTSALRESMPSTTRSFPRSSSRPCARSSAGAPARRSCSPSSAARPTANMRAWWRRFSAPALCNGGAQGHVISVETEGSIENALLLGRGPGRLRHPAERRRVARGLGRGAVRGRRPAREDRRARQPLPGAGAHRGLGELGHPQRRRPARQAGRPRHAAIGHPAQRARRAAGPRHRAQGPRRGARRRHAGRDRAAARRPHRRLRHHGGCAGTRLQRLAAEHPIRLVPVSPRPPLAW